MRLATILSKQASIRGWITILAFFAIFYSLLTNYRCLLELPKYRPHELPLNPPTRADRKHVRPKIIYDHSHLLVSQEADFYLENCLVTRKSELSHVADAVAITWRKTSRPSLELPTTRFSWQRWVWIMDESPFHSGEDLTAADGVFNWTMTYRKDSDVYIPYGVYKPREKTVPIPDYIGTQKEFVSVVVSNNNLKFVHNGRYGLVMKLKKFIPITIYGQVGEPCEGFTPTKNQYLKPCPFLKDFLFYLAFENSNCKEYITEKVFANAFSSGAVPVVFGASKEDYVKHLPPNSFVYVRDFPSVEKLAKYLVFLSSNTSAYMEYHEWRKQYVTSYIAQYNTPSIWKPLCDALNKDDGSESIKTISTWWGLKDCEAHTDTYVYE